MNHDEMISAIEKIEAPAESIKIVDENREISRTTIPYRKYPLNSNTISAIGICPPHICHIISDGILEKNIMNKRKRIPEIAFEYKIFRKLYGICNKMVRVLFFLSLLTIGINTNGRNREKIRNIPPNVGVKTPGTGSNPFA